MVYTVSGVNYTRRKKIPVTGAASGAQTDYQIKLAATWAAAMQADFDDVRFTKADMQTLIDAWLESKVDSTSADIWVKFLTTPADGVVKTGAYMYFGNDVIASDWDGATTFEYFDDYELISIYRPIPNKNGAWCWFQDPRAIHYNGTYNKTYATWTNGDKESVIWSFRHDTEATENFTLGTAATENDHHSPAILLRNDHHLIAFYGEYDSANTHYRISTNVEDISAWGTEQNWGGERISYFNPVQISGESNKIYVFYRDRVDPGPVSGLYYKTSTDGGSNWSSSTKLLNTPTGHYFTYFKVASDDTDKIHFAVTDAHGATTNPHRDIYYFYYYGNSFYKADGTKICDIGDLPMDLVDLEKIYDSSGAGNYDCWVWDIALNGSGYPYIVFATFESTTIHHYRYAYWNGSSWNDKYITAGGSGLYSPELYYSGGVVLDHDDINTVYVSKQVSGEWEIQKHVTSDGGDSWTPTNITSGSTKKNIRPVVIRNHTSDMKVMWMYGDYTSYFNVSTNIISDSEVTTSEESSIIPSFIGTADDCTETQSHSSSHSITWTTPTNRISVSMDKPLDGGAIAFWIYVTSTTGRINTVIVIDKGGSINTDSGVYTKFEGGIIYAYNGSSWVDTGLTYTTGWHRFEVIQGATTSDLKLDSSSVNDVANRNTISEIDKLTVYYDSGTTYYDDVFVCKYVANPPTAAFGTEEHQRRTPMMM